MSIEAAVRSMLTANVTLSAYPITHAYRLQDSNLPAITFEVTSNERSATKDQWLATVDIRTIAVETSSALSMSDAVRIACVPGTFLLGFAFNAVIYRGRTVDPPTVGEGDEQQPAEVTTNIEIYWSE